MKSFNKLVLFGALAASSAGLSSCTQPKIECTVGQSVAVVFAGNNFNDQLTFAVKYIPVSETPTGCAAMNGMPTTGELIGMQTFHPDSGDKTRDLSKTSVAIRSDFLGDFSYTIEDFTTGPDIALQQKLSSVGDFSTLNPGDDDFCTIPSFSSQANLTWPDLTDEMGTVLLPAGSMTYEWSDVRIYVTAAAPGTQFTGHVKITYQDVCAVEYDAVGMWPATDCGVYGPLEPDNPDSEFGLVGTDINFCNPVSDLNATPPRIYGSGINPDFGPLICEPVFEASYRNAVLLGYAAGSPAGRCLVAGDRSSVPALEGFESSEGIAGGN